jgi:hypothetical protein
VPVGRGDGKYKNTASGIFGLTNNPEAVWSWLLSFGEAGERCLPILVNSYIKAVNRIGPLPALIPILEHIKPRIAQNRNVQ